ncbi:hypothetical protein AU184_26330 [Mycolicibacterium novocastrense]|uniref:CAP domain-containing protein n=1 Tax=Mycolicibacterium novocastrense TaxID=59813 RepID=UPI00074A7713|nr:CAP domain-containing protein [Mycolicibacterium novocastrense]KUH67470.1 hypothetical protein AU183_00065 [Mycolicibacterium novocastrense]KUH68190.1 hypothetical protein AU184_26330 [Mycolicibacterium novocastrense]KUH74397.1 hypothetical protein AU072_17410 [Mycolicibacterium novocastrense]
MRHIFLRAATVPCAVALLAAASAPSAYADNTRLNNGVIANVYTVQRQAGCYTNIKKNPALTLAAEWHANDVLNNHALDGDLGSDGSTPQERAAVAGFRGKVAQTVAINHALAINNVDVINQWYYDPAAFAIMSDCANSVIGVWSVNSLARSVLVAVYGQPA